jgi:hypothetical protein
MTGWRIFIHSVRQVFGNLEGAIRVSILPYAIQTVVTLALLGNASALVQELSTGGPAQGLPAGVALKLAVVWLITLVSAMWIAVAWHRFVLIEDVPYGFVPAFRGGQIWAYFVRTLGISLIAVAVGMVLGVVAGIVTYPMASRGATLGPLILFGVIVLLPLLIIISRLSASLPAAALGTDQAFFSGWEATKGHTAEVVGLSVITTIASLAIQVIGTQILGGLSLLQVAWEIIIGWVAMMVGVSIITTLYGHYVEGRPLR